MASIMETMNDVIKVGLASLQIQPSAYSYLFPLEVTPGQIQELVLKNVFPTVEGLAPAFTYAILLGIARYLLHLLVFKVE